MRVCRRDRTKRRKQPANLHPVFVERRAFLRAAGIVHQRVTGNWRARSMCDQDCVDQALHAEAPILEGPTDSFRPIGLFAHSCESKSGRDGF